jgi:hypothetical protein
MRLRCNLIAGSPARFWHMGEEIPDTVVPANALKYGCSDQEAEELLEVVRLLREKAKQRASVGLPLPRFRTARLPGNTMTADGQPKARHGHLNAKLSNGFVNFRQRMDTSRQLSRDLQGR